MGGQAERVAEIVQVGAGRTEHRRLLGDDDAGNGSVLDLGVHGQAAQLGLGDQALSTFQRTPCLRHQDIGRAEGQVAREGDFGGRRKEADARIGGGGCGRQDEARLGEVHAARDGLHLVAG